MIFNRIPALRRVILLGSIWPVLILPSWGQTTPGIQIQSTLKAENGLQRLLFTFPQGRLVVNLPDDIRPGDTISGTVSSEPAGTNEAEKRANESVLAGLVIDLGGDQKVKGDTPRFTWLPKVQIPSTPPRYLLRAVSVFSSDRFMGALNIPINLSTQPAVSVFTLPLLGQTGRNIFITGPFDGRIDNTKCDVGTGQCKILAESPRSIVAVSPTSLVGLTTLTVADAKGSLSGVFRNVGIGLSAPKTNLSKGEKTVVNVLVLGLDGLKDAVSVEVITTGAVNMDGGNSQTILIAPKSVMVGGAFSVGKEITAIQAGAFNVTATVLVPSILPHRRG